MTRPYVRLDKNDVTVLLVDHQAGLLSVARDFDADAFKTADGEVATSLRLICEKVHAYGDVQVGSVP